MVLILTCNVLIWTALGSSFESITKTDIVAGMTSVPVYTFKHYDNWIFYFLQIILWIISIFVCAWLVGWKYKIQDVVFAGMILTGIGMVLKTVVYTVQVGRNEDEATEIWRIACVHATTILTAIGSGPVVTNLLQLTLEQIPEASTAQISALVSWFVFTSGLGILLNDVIRTTYKHCLELSQIQYYLFKPYENLVYTGILGIAVAIFAMLKNKLIDNSPTSFSLHTLCGVIKYAIQHKYPKQRSALTYWEEELPGRLNLGKRKYGGPFNNEEVEDVRTLINISILCLTTFLYLSSLYFLGFSFYYVDHNHKNSTGDRPGTCEEFLKYQLAGNNMLWHSGIVLIYELVLVPIIYYRMPNMIRRAGLVAILAYLLAFASGIVIISLHYSDSFNPKASDLQIGLAVFVGGLKAIFYISALEFICAQSPYAMRNFFICSGILIIWCSQILAGIVFFLWKIKCTMNSCHVYCVSTGIVLLNLAILIFIISAKLYKRRTRGHEDEHQQRWVEEAYNKYISNRSMSVTGSFKNYSLEASPN